MNAELLKYAAFFKAFCLAILICCGVESFSQQGIGVPNIKKLYVRVDSVSLSGNKITRDQIILREIVFKSGDYMRIDSLDSLIARSKENLLNTSLFNFVDLEKSFPDPDSIRVNISVKVTERWYIWPTLILKIADRNFNVWWQTKDFSRISYGFNIDWRNFRGRKEDLILRLQWGYNRAILLQYHIPYLNQKKTLGMGFGFCFLRQRETAYQTIHNKQEFFKEPDGYVRKDYYAYGKFLIRRNIYNTHELELRYDQHQFSDSLLVENINYTIDSAADLQYISFRYLYKSDHRDYKPYPLVGNYFDIELLKHGIWTFNENTINTIQLKATYRHYWELHPRIFFASGLNCKLSAGSQPYFILKGIGYDRDMVRSYEYYLVDAQHFGIFKNNVKFALVPNKVMNIGFVGVDNFSKVFYALYLNVFFDAGYGFYNQDFGQETNDLQNALLLGYGAGLDFVTYYDIVVRFECSINFMNEAGLFLHMRAPI